MNDKIIDKFLDKNPEVRLTELYIRADGRLEWVCEHGIGHTVWHPKGSDFVHGCCHYGCCKKIKVIKRIRK